MSMPFLTRRSTIRWERNPACCRSDHLKGSICIVTGASSGIGKATALGLARLGATVVMVCRDRARGEAAQSEIVRVTGHHAVDLLIADLSIQSSVHTLADDFSGKYRKLNVLVNNAGVLLSTRRLTSDGIETTFAVNHLAPFLLTNLLLSLLRRSAPSRIINVSSSAHTKTLDFGNLQAERFYRPMQTYGQSKLENILFTCELARRLDGSGVTVNSVHPGLVRSGITRDIRGAFGALITFTSPFYRSPAKGAETVIYLASSKEVAGVTGRYFMDKKEIRSAPVSHDTAVARRLWDVSERLTNVHPIVTTQNRQCAWAEDDPTTRIGEHLT